MSRVAVLLGLIGIIFQPLAQVLAESEDWWTQDTEIDADGNQGRSQEHGPGSKNWPPLEAARRLFGLSHHFPLPGTSGGVTRP